MAIIWKFPIDSGFKPDGSLILEMPQGAEILTVQVQGETPCVWAKVDPNLAKEARKFFIVGTGKTFPEGAAEYIGTFQMNGGALVWHLYEGDV